MDGTILVADDDRTIRTVLTQALTRAGCKVHATSSLVTLMRWVEEGKGDLVISDVMMPDGNGLDLVQEMRRERPKQVAIMITGYADVNDAMRAVRDGLFDYLTKPFEDLEAIETVIGRALELDSAYREIGNLREVLGGRKGPVLIAGSRVMKNLMIQKATGLTHDLAPVRYLPLRQTQKLLKRLQVRETLHTKLLLPFG